MTHDQRSAKVRRRVRFLIPGLALAGAAACGRSAPSDSKDLSRDLELARGQGLELAPRPGGQSTVSAAELVPSGSHKASTSPRAPQKAPTVAPKRSAPVIAQAPEPTTVETVLPVPEAPVPAAPAPATPDPVRPQPMSAKPAMNPAPPGGYKSMGELIRKAPFPINP